MTPKARDGEFATPRTSGRPPERSTHLATQVMFDPPMLMPTPTVGDSRNSRNCTQNDGEGSKRGVPGVTLSDAAWLDARGLWPTPTANPNEDRRSKPNPAEIEGRHGWSLNSAVIDSESGAPHRLWPTPNVPNGGRGFPKDAVVEGNTARTPDGRKVQVELHHAVEMSERMWPTPVANDTNRSPEAYRAMKANMKGGPRTAVTSLQVAATEADRMWPSPMATEARQGFQDRTRGMKGSQESLSTVAMKSDGQAAGGRKLNADFVERLMGYPSQWTALSGDPAPHLDPEWDGDPLGAFGWGWEYGVPLTVEGKVEHRVNRLKGLGNAVVPQVPFAIFSCIQQAIDDHSNRE